MENFSFAGGVVVIFVGLILGSFGSYTQRTVGALVAIGGLLAMLLSLYFKYVAGA